MHLPFCKTFLAEAKTCVFWDVEDCPIPNGLDPCLISQNIKTALEKKGYNRRNVSIRVYGEKNKSMDDDANIIFFPRGDKRARLLRMVMDLFMWVMDNPESNLMVISEDNTEFASCLRNLKAVNCNILQAQPENAPQICRNCRMPLEELITDEWLWETLSPKSQKAELCN